MVAAGVFQVFPVLDDVLCLSKQRMFYELQGQKIAAKPIFFFSHLFCFCAGPHAETASGCQNLQCGFRACCRSGE